MEHDDEYNINYEYIPRYISRTLKPNEGILEELEAYAKAHDVPIAKLETIRFIEVLLKSAKAKRVLEVGAAIGYSAIAMANCGADVVTIERDEKMIEQLLPNIERAGHSEHITVYEGDAEEILPKLQGEFDFIFLDAAKSKYLEFFPHCLRMLKEGGMLFSDNVLYKGMVATDELVIRRKITIIKRMRNYLDEICNHQALDTAIIPIGDGAALSYKRKII